MLIVRKKLLLSVLMIAFFLTAASTKTAKANPGIVANIVPSAGYIGAVEQFYVNVTISGIEVSHDLVGMEFQIIWNTTLVTGISMELPDGHIFQEAEDDGNLWVVKKAVNDSSYPNCAWYFVTCSDLIAGYDAGYLPLTGSGVICKITFNATETLGNSTLVFRELPPTYQQTMKLSDGDGVQITDYETFDSSIEVIPEFSSSLLYVILLMLSLVVVVAYKKLPKKQTLTLRR